MVGMRMPYTLSDLICIFKHQIILENTISKDHFLLLKPIIWNFPVPTDVTHK